MDRECTHFKIHLINKETKSQPVALIRFGGVLEVFYWPEFHQNQASNSDLTHDLRTELRKELLIQTLKVQTISLADCFGSIILPALQQPVYINGHSKKLAILITSRDHFRHIFGRIVAKESHQENCAISDLLTS